MPDRGGYWNIFEKLAELHNCDDTQCGSTSLILGPERMKGVAAGRWRWPCTRHIPRIKNEVLNIRITRLAL
jgi:hypothetical protein